MQMRMICLWEAFHTSHCSLHPFPQRIGRRPAGAGALGPPFLLPFARPVLAAVRLLPSRPAERALSVS